LGVGHRFWACCRVPFRENKRSNARLFFNHGWTQMDTDYLPQKSAQDAKGLTAYLRLSALTCRDGREHGG